MTPGARRDVSVLRVQISAHTFLVAACAVGLAWLLVHLWPILLLIVGSLIVAGTISPLADGLERRGVGRGWSVTAVFVILSGAIALLLLLVAPALMRELLAFIEDAPAMQAKLALLLSHNVLMAPLAAAVGAFRIETLWAGNLGSAMSYSKGLAELIGYATTSLVLALYLVADRDRARGFLYAFVPRAYHLRLARILQNLVTIVGGYMRGQLITSLSIALFVFLLLAACNVRGALAFAACAAITDVIPFIGGLLATVPAVLAAMHNGVSTTLVVLVALTLYQQFENRLLVPRIYGRAMRLPPAAVVLAILIGGRLLGAIGALLALPIAAGLRMVVEELRIELPGDDSDDAALRASDARNEQSYDVRSSGSSPEEAGAMASKIASEIRVADAADLAAMETPPQATPAPDHSK